MRGRLSRLAVVAAASAGALTGLAQSAGATGYALREGDTDWMANAFSGETAKAYDASTAYANPAGMVRLNRNEIAQSVNVIVPNESFSGANFVGPGITTPGTNGGNAAHSAVSPALYAVWSYAPNLKFGFTLSAPFGQRVVYPAEFVGRYQSNVSSVTDISASFSAAYAFDKHFSIGVGPVINYFYARLTQALNTGPTSAITGDPAVDMHGEDVALGYNVGALYQFNDNLRLGIDYRSRIKHDLYLQQSVFVPPLISQFNPAVASQLQALLDTNTRTSVTLPDNVETDLYWQLSPKWALMGGFQWTHWSLFNNLTFVPQNGGPTARVPENWRNSWFISTGANWQVLPRLLLQAGFAWDQSPVTNSNRTTRLPDSDRYMLGIGAQYVLTPNTTLRFAYAHQFLSPESINNSASPTAGVIVGNYSIHADTISLGAVMRF